MKQALLIIDMSNDFVHDEGGLTAGACAQEIVPFIEEKANEFLAAGQSVYICMDAHKENDPHFKLWPKHNVKVTGDKSYTETYKIGMRKIKAMKMCIGWIKQNMMLFMKRILHKN